MDIISKKINKQKNFVVYIKINSKFVLLKLISIFLVLTYCNVVLAETNDKYDLLGTNDNEEKVNLLPDKMMFSQNLIYGENGFLRFTGLVPLTPDLRENEMKVRRVMLLTHQIVGYLTLVSIIGTAITGQMLYDDNLSKYIHSSFATATNIGYGLGALMVFTAPPPLIKKEKDKWDSVDWHSSMAYLHFLGMVSTNFFSDLAGSNSFYKNIHRISGFVTAATFTGSVVVVSIEF